MTELGDEKEMTREEQSKKVDPSQAKVSREFKHTRPLTSCHWDPRSRFVFFGAEDNLVHRFDVESGAVIPLAVHDSWVRGFASSPDGETLYTGGYDGRLVFWPAGAESPAPIRAIEGHDGWIRAVAASPCGKYLATCGNDLLVKLWDAIDGRLLQEFSGHQWHVYNLIFLPGSTRIISCDLKGVVRSWLVGSAESHELATVKQLHEYDTTFRADIGGARGIAIRPDGRVVALGGITNVSNAFAGVGEIAIALVHTDTGAIERVLESKEKTKGTIWGVAHHGDGFWIGVSGGGGGGWLHFWHDDAPTSDNPASENSASENPASENSSSDNSSSDSSTSDSANGDSVEANHEFARVKLPNDGRGMSLAPDQRHLAVAHADMHLRLYEF